MEFLYISEHIAPTTRVKITSNQVIKIHCEEDNNTEFIIPYETAKKSSFISNMLHMEETGIQYKEAQEKVLKLPQFKAAVLEEVSFLFSLFLFFLSLCCIVFLFYLTFEVFRFCALDSLMNPINPNENDQADWQDSYHRTPLSSASPSPLPLFLSSSSAPLTL